jgi:O-succinylbenzoic acid--CoA ligase
MFTSGTGGEPKAAVHTFGNHYYSALGANEHIPVAPGDRWLLSLPLYHVGGLGIVFRALWGKAAVVILQAQENIAGAILKYQVTHVSLVPTQFYRLLSDEKNIKALRNLKVILLGGGPVPDSLIRQSAAYNLPLHATYGLTEMASQVAISSRLTKRNSTPKAKVLPCREVYISNKNEILVRGKTLFKGYIQGGKIHRPLNKKGWFYTGDLGCLDEDGMLRVTGRQDNMFISGGENIQPEEIERHLCRIEGIVQAVVVPVPDEEFGARPVAFVQRQEGVDLVPKEIVSRLSQHLPRFKIPRRIYAWPTAVPRRGIKLDRAYFLRLARQEAPSPKGNLPYHVPPAGFLR